MQIPIKYTKRHRSSSSIQNTFQIATHIEPDEVKYFLQKKYGRRFWSEDKEALKAEGCRDNIRKLYDLLELPFDEPFVSAYVKNRDFSGDHCWCYGPICLILKIEKIKDKTMIFNGDVKNLAFKIFAQNSSPEKYLRTHSIDTPMFKTLVHLQRYYWNMMAWAMFKKPFFPRMIGCCFEARIFRPITSADIEIIVIPHGLGKKEMKLVESLADSIAKPSA